MNLGLLSVSFSSLRSGSPSELVARSLNNITTDNQEHSFLQIDLNEDKTVLPASYSLRNRPSTTHCLSNWVLEGSTDGHQFYVLDQRVHHTQDVNYNHLMAPMQAQLTTKAAVNTFHLDPNKVSQVLSTANSAAPPHHHAQGFRTFRLLQLFKNTHNTYNMCLSNLELYGRAFGTGFNLP